MGGSGKVSMPELRALCESLGHSSVASYLNSGNVVFASPSRDEAALGAELERALAKLGGAAPPCLVRSGRCLRAVIDANPYPEQAAANGKLVHATFLSEPVDEERFAAVDAADFAPEDYTIGDRVIYMHLPEGTGRSKLATALARPSLLDGIIGTTRNWNTVAKLAEMTGA